MESLTLGKLHPFVRCVGLGTGLWQNGLHCAYDHRMLIALSGRGLLLTEEGELPIQEGGLVLISPGTPYCVHSETSQQLIVVNFDWDYSFENRIHPILSVPVQSFEPDRIQGVMDWSAFLPAGNIAFLSAGTEARTLALRMYDLWLAPDQDGRAGAMVQTGLFLQLLATLYGSGIRKGEAAERIYSFLCEHFAEPITLDTVAEKFHFHPTYINRLLKAAYGVSFRQLLIRRRLMQGLSMLENTGLSVREIALAVGFYDEKHFTVAFRKRYGNTPSRFR